MNSVSAMQAEIRNISQLRKDLWHTYKEFHREVKKPIDFTNVSEENKKHIIENDDWLRKLDNQKILPLVKSCLTSSLHLSYEVGILYKFSFESLIQNLKDLARKFAEVDNFTFQIKRMAVNQGLGKELVDKCDSIKDTSHKMQMILKDFISFASDVHTMLLENESRIKQELHKLYSQRHAFTIDMSAIHPKLKGVLYIKVLYDPAGRVYSVSRPDSPMEWIYFFSYFQEKHGMSPKEATAALSKMIYDSFMELAKSKGKVFSDLFLHDKVPLTIQVILSNAYHNKCTIKIINLEQGADSGLIPTTDFDRVDVIMPINQMVKSLEQYLRGKKSILNYLSNTFVHEITHAVDRKNLQIKHVLDKIRGEGLATFSEFIVHPERRKQFIQHVQVSKRLSSNTIKSVRRLEKNKELQNILYSYGFFMCLVIFVGGYNRKHPIKIFARNIEVICDMLNEEKAVSFGVRYIRMIKGMRSYDFFFNFIREAMDQKITIPFSPEFINEIQQLKI